MRHIVAACLLLAAVTPPAYAGGSPTQKPNTLTPKEIADGWILLFDGETTFGWKVEGPNRVHEGNLVLGGAHKTLAVNNALLCTEFELEYTARGQGWVSNIGLLGLQVRSFELREEKWQANRAHSYTRRDQKGSNTHYTDGFVRKEGSWFRWSQAQSPITWWKKRDLFQFALDVGPEKKFEIRDVKFRPLAMKPLFNGKNLDGWKEFPGKKSKFAVVDDAINVKDGPGDLQTVGKYKDFVLQLDCISHGKHLNSGIFFRCRDNEYQNGYEAQIHNGFLEMPKKYLVEEYDPKANKLIGKKEMLFNAIDYGTGAIYRRMPARKQMAKDGEWFTMTVVAHGNHIATWVNGVQVTDWTDNRPKSDNARLGCKLEAGHISIQGHDPTTNLSFKNIRIAELK